MLTPRFPYPPDRGDTVRSWYELEYLAKRHDVWLASLNEREPERADLNKVRDICRDVVVLTRPPWRSLLAGGLSLLGGKSLIEGYFTDKRFLDLIRQLARSIRFDALLAFTTVMGAASERVDARRVLDMCDVDSGKFETYARRSRSPLRLIYSLEALRLRAAERRQVSSHDATLVVNRRERQKLLALMTPRRVEIVHTCVTPPPTSSPVPAAPVPAAPVVGCVGSMFYPPNVRAVNWFGCRVWPQVKKRLPAARWLIVGARPTRSVRRWSRLPGVEVTGYVRDTRPYLDSIRVFINPVDGDIGVQSKLLGAMAAGKPAVVTPDTAAGIDYQQPPPFLIADSPQAFTDATLSLLTDDDLAADISVRALRTVEERYLPHTQLWRVEQALQAESPAPASVRRDAIMAEEEVAALP